VALSCPQDSAVLLGEQDYRLIRSISAPRQGLRAGPEVVLAEPSHYARGSSFPRKRESGGRGVLRPITWTPRFRGGDDNTQRILGFISGQGSRDDQFLQDIRKSGVQRDRSETGGDRFEAPTLELQCVGELEMRVGDARVDFQ
jgi:hypothetical protein